MLFRSAKVSSAQKLNRVKTNIIQIIIPQGCRSVVRVFRRNRTKQGSSWCYNKPDITVELTVVCTALQWSLRVKNSSRTRALSKAINFYSEANLIKTISTPFCGIEILNKVKLSGPAREDD